MSHARNILLVMIIAMPFTNSYAANFIHFNIGRLNQDRSIEGIASNGITTITISDKSDESGGVFGAGYSRLTDSSYFTLDAYFPRADEDTYYIFEASPHLYFSNGLYAGATLGCQKY